MTGSSSPVTAVDASVSHSAGDVQMLVFDIGKEEFAFTLTEIQEIITIMPLTPVPHAPPAIRGIVNVRGKVATAVDLATVLGLHDEKSTPQYMIMAEFEKNLYAILVDTVTGVLRTSSNHLRKTPDLFASKAAAQYVSGALVIPKNASGAHGDSADNGSDVAGLNDSRIILSLHLPSIFAAAAVSSAS